jgi:predicted protein tyrosine phosphatase
MYISSSKAMFSSTIPVCPLLQINSKHVRLNIEAVLSAVAATEREAYRSPAARHLIAELVIVLFAYAVLA